MELNGKVALITGATGNVGPAVARALAEKGASLALTGTRQSALDELYADLKDAQLVGGIDITQPEGIGKLVAAVKDRWGRIDILVNVAGTFKGGTPVHETPLETWDLLMNLNARSVFLICQAVVPVMLAGGGGRIVNIGARPAVGAGSGNGAYAASKSAVIRLTEAMAAELKNQGVNVNCVLPSIIDAEANRRDMPNADFSKWVAPEALADVIAFLCSDGARAIHGAAIPVYGRV